MKHLFIIRPGEEFTIFSERTEESFSVKAISVVGPDIAIGIETESNHISISSLSGIRRSTL